MRHIRDSFALALLLSFGCAPGSTGDEATRSGAEQPASKASSEDGALNLRGAPVRGATRRTELIFDVTDAQLVMSVAGVSLTGTLEMTTTSTDDLEILEVADGLVTKGRLSHVLDKSTMKTRITMPDGTNEESVDEELGALHGRAETIEFSSGQWTRTLEGAAPSPEAARLLDARPIDDAMYPTSIKVGESWTESGPELRRWLGSDVLSARGEVKSTLVAVETEGEKIAVIESIGEITATMLDTENRELTMTMGIQGHTRRSLDRALDLEGSATGAIKLSGEFVADGTPTKLTVTGRYAVKFSGSLR